MSQRSYTLTLTLTMTLSLTLTLTPVLHPQPNPNPNPYPSPSPSPNPNLHPNAKPNQVVRRKRQMERQSLGGPVRPAAHLGQLGCGLGWLGREGCRGGLARAAGGAGGALELQRSPTCALPGATSLLPTSLLPTNSLLLTPRLPRAQTCPRSKNRV